jgi:anti-sigma-K factor RskA
MTDSTMEEPGADDARTQPPEILAGELALRVLSPDEERAARAREQADPAFAAEVEAWNAHLAAFAAEVQGVTPSAGVWPRIQGGIDSVANDAANDNGRLGFWRGWAIGSTGLLAASLVAVAVLIARPAPVPEPAPTPAGGVTRVATLTLSEGGAPAVTIAYDTVTGNLFVAPTAAIAASDGVPHLWLVRPEGGVQLVGAIDGAEASHRTLSAALSGQVGTATAVAISMEARGTTPPADAPRGPVVASGELQQL